MKRERITVLANGQTIKRVPFDMDESGGYFECWVRYRGGRLFVMKSKVFENHWIPFRFEPRRGNSYAV